jgi:hypothetical protein
VGFGLSNWLSPVCFGGYASLAGTVRAKIVSALGPESESSWNYCWVNRRRRHSGGNDVWPEPKRTTFA